MAMKKQDFTKNSKITRSEKIPVPTGKALPKKADKKVKEETSSSNRSRTVRMDRDIVHLVKLEAIKRDTTMKDYLESLVIKELGIEVNE